MLDVPIVALSLHSASFPSPRGLKCQTVKGDPFTELSLCHVFHPLEALRWDFVQTCVTKLVILCYECLVTSLSFQVEYKLRTACKVSFASYLLWHSTGI